ncbi:abortive infection family protein [Limnobacter parvus]|uniref:Abortive infection family protein n=1 Tax=Limnobacter parvus TaxID=2939690 RepID=A0ABT1XDF1_9BURK|nr:abortive infection family protein [Limnobacter parvus]MCR2745290.1 abortive infection family protein [Limnobacter parvus]
MTMDWCPGIREACAHWQNATMLQHTFDALQMALESDSDASIDAVKGLVECICRVIIDQLDDPTSPLKPKDEASITEWVSAAIRVLGRGDVRDRKFADLIKHHNGLAESLRVLRNDAGPFSHGKDGFIQALTIYHRRAAILAADALVTFLYKAYLDSQLDPISSREPWERFAEGNALIDAHVGLVVDDDDSTTLRFILPSGDELPINIEVSRLLYQLDREAYVEALNAARGAQKPAQVREQGEH